MKIGFCKEIKENEKRTVCVPDIIEKLKKIGVETFVENDIGKNLGINNQKYIESGACIIESKKKIFEISDIILKINRPLNEEINLIKENQIIISLINQKLENLKQDINKLIIKKTTYFALELLPRISRAQSMDVLSSQANLLGYKSVILAANKINRMFPMMTTSAGNIKPIKILIIGAGVAGLQAIATAKRLGALVFSYDVRKEVKEQIESLGAKFLNINTEEKDKSKDGYAKEINKEEIEKIQEKILEFSREIDIIITTANIPWKKAPVLIKKEIFNKMKPNSLIIDLVSEFGGNVEGVEKDKELIINEIQLLSPTNLLSEIAFDASSLFSKNVYNFLELILNKKEKQIEINFEDEILEKSCLLYKGNIKNNILMNI